MPQCKIYHSGDKKMLNFLKAKIFIYFDVFLQAGEIDLHMLYSYCILLAAEFRCYLGKTRCETFQTTDSI